MQVSISEIPPIFWKLCKKPGACMLVKTIEFDGIRKGMI